MEATIKAIVDTTEGVRLQVSFGEETALIYPWQIVIEARSFRRFEALEFYRVAGRPRLHLLHHGKRHLPTVLRLITEANRKLP